MRGAAGPTALPGGVPRGVTRPWKQFRHGERCSIEHDHQRHHVRESASRSPSGRRTSASCHDEDGHCAQVAEQRKTTDLAVGPSGQHQTEGECKHYPRPGSEDPGRAHISSNRGGKGHAASSQLRGTRAAASCFRPIWLKTRELRQQPIDHAGHGVGRALWLQGFLHSAPGCEDTGSRRHLSYQRRAGLQVPTERGYSIPGASSCT